ncbi:BamA/TamA family outer membrane protein [Halocynthiibacter namhaensis]|uniref:BamA/TamA family outer membrane protein n=1 Tax=Halocynthiibacter namhaensis TaxID=1290553 RepID=UPI0005791457|nr:BamA/TamA family outer membrane protein [Halocynthiibacter namhaensis]
MGKSQKICAIFTAAIMLFTGSAWAQNGPGGQLSTGLSYSSKYGATSFVTLEGQDIFKSGISARLNYRAGTEGHGAGLRLAKRFELGDRWPGLSPELTFAIYGKSADWDFQSYAEKTQGFSVLYGADLSPQLSFETELFFHRDELDNLSSGVSPLIAADAGRSDVLGAGIDLSWSNRSGSGLLDKGTQLSFGIAATVSGTGNRGWHRFSAKLDSTHGFVGESVVNFSLGTGVIRGQGSNGYVNILDRAFSGDGAPRGFAWGGAGPVAPGTDEALGGTRYLSGSVEVRTPLARDGLSAGVFFDAGSVWDLPGITGVDDDMYMRTSAGVAVHWQTRFGRLEAAYAEPLRTRASDRTQRFSISLSAKF